MHSTNLTYKKNAPLEFNLTERLFSILKNGIHGGRSIRCKGCSFVILFLKLEFCKIIATPIFVTVLDNVWKNIKSHSSPSFDFAEGNKKSERFPD
ncbi:MAG: hypothetical protein J6K89_02870, partial [Oscillospiraceae bacterium]|nr:hypothetical protein [Oscillospiraceae bacterium]